MEYLIYAGVFIGGWVLAKLDRMAGGKYPMIWKISLLNPLDMVLSTAMSIE